MRALPLCLFRIRKALEKPLAAQRDDPKDTLLLTEAGAGGKCLLHLCARAERAASNLELLANLG